jgi:hypothetical protein
MSASARRKITAAQRSCHLAGFLRRLSRGAWLFRGCYRSFSRFGFNCRGHCQLGLFRSAMVAMAQRLDARSLFFRPQLSVATFLALVLKICRNRFSCHSQSVAELVPSKLSNFGHSVDDSWATTKRWRVGEGFVSLYPTHEQSRDQEAHTRASRCRDSTALL